MTSTSCETSTAGAEAPGGDPAARPSPGALERERAQKARVAVEFQREQAQSQRQRAEREQHEAEARSISRRREVRAIGAPGEQLDDALHDGDPGVRRAALANKHCSGEQRMAALHRDPEPDVQMWAEALLPAVCQLPADLATRVFAGDGWSVRALIDPGGRQQSRRTYVFCAAEPALGRVAVTCRDGSHPSEARYAAIPGCGGPGCGEPECDDPAAYVVRHWGASLRLGGADPGARRHAEARSFLVSAPAAPVDLLADFARRDPDSGIRAAAVANPSFPPELLDRPASDVDPRVRRSVLSHGDVAAALVAALAVDADGEVRLVALSHPNCPADHLAQAVAAPESTVRRTALGNANCPPAAADEALRHSDARTRLASLARPLRLHPQAVFDCLIDALAALDRWHRDRGTPRRPSVRRGAAVGPDWQAGAAVDVRDAAVDALRLLADSQWSQVCALPLGRLPQECLRPIVSGNVAAAARDRRVPLRVLAVEDPSCDEERLMGLGCDPQVTVRLALAGREDLPRRVQRLLMLDEDDTVVCRLAGHPYLDEGVAREMIAGCSAAVRRVLAGRVDLGAPSLRRLARDPEPQVREAASRRLLELL